MVAAGADAAEHEAGPTMQAVLARGPQVQCLAIAGFRREIALDIRRCSWMRRSSVAVTLCCACLNLGMAFTLVTSNSNHHMQSAYVRLKRECLEFKGPRKGSYYLVSISGFLIF